MLLSSAERTRAPYPIFQRPACPQCGYSLFAASATEFLGHGKIRNTLSCASCEHEFRTAYAMPIEN